MSFVKVRNVLIALVSIAGICSATDIFKDDFSSCSFSNQKWLPQGVTVTCTNQMYKLQNTSTQYAGALFYQFPTSVKCSTFTYSAKITRSVASKLGGLYFCKRIQEETTTNGTVQYVLGYIVAIGDQGNIQISKASKSAVTELFSTHSGYVLSGTNVIKVSKKDQTINLFCNDHFITSITDASYSYGDIGVYVDKGQTVDLDDVLFTDQFTSGQAPVMFSDNFENSSLLGWNAYPGSGTYSVANGKLQVNTSATGFVFLYTALNLTDAEGNVEVSHIDGDKTSFYGLFVSGKPIGDSVPTILFGIAGNKQYGVIIPGKSFSPGMSSSIGGAAYVDGSTKEYYIDTLSFVII